MSRSLEDFTPIKDGEVKMYTCGPTVYDVPHIGNWYAFVRWDILNRMFIASGFKTKWVMNITDVGHLVSDADEGEDKLEKGAKREGKNAWDVAQKFTDYFIKSLDRLNFSEPQALPRATDHIKEQIEFIKKLEKNGYTYSINDGIYFESSKLPDYGKLARLDLDSLKAGARVEHNAQKHNLSDFALWKFSPENHKRDMEWDSPWGVGFPGWHLECSALIENYLGDTIDIHAGGIDHIPVHHTNEIAQSESIHHKTLANYWLHTNFIKVDSQKLSKSLGNLITLEDIELKGFSLQAFRTLVLESHYRTEAQFSWETLQAAQNRLNDLKAMAQLKWQLQNDAGVGIEKNMIQPVLESLQDDLNTPEALSKLSRIANKLLEKGVSESDEQKFKDLLNKIDDLLGLELSEEQDISEDNKKLIADRQQARNSKDWATSDKIREILISQHIEVRDTLNGPIWNQY